MGLKLQIHEWSSTLVTWLDITSEVAIELDSGDLYDLEFFERIGTIDNIKFKLVNENEQSTKNTEV